MQPTGQPLTMDLFLVPAALGPLRQEHGDGKVIRDILAFYFAHIMAATEEFNSRCESCWRHFDFSETTNRDHLVFQLAVLMVLELDYAWCN